LQPDPEQARREAVAERQRLDAARAAMSRSDLEALVEATRTLKRLQETPDPPEGLATIPTLALEDLTRWNKVIPIEATRVADTPGVLSRTACCSSTSVSTCRYCLPTSCYMSRCSRERFWETGAGQQDFASLSLSGSGARRRNPAAVLDLGLSIRKSRRRGCSCGPKRY
jgi:peptidase M16-like protein